MTTLAEAARRIQAGDSTAAELVEMCLERAAFTEPLVHAYAAIDADHARTTAAERDAELRAGKRRGPLHGIPVAMKDVIWTTRLPTEAGSKALAGFRPPFNATVVDQLEQAGAIIVGKTVTHEFAYGQDVPPTRCAWDTTCYPGGSSAGSGVAVSVGSALAAVGTDTGGSIRNPAAVNGIVGLKPTNGRVSRYGVIPVSHSLDCVGPLAREVEDCALMLSAMAGTDPRDACALPEPVPDYAAAFTGDGRARIGVERSLLDATELHEDVRRSFDEALVTLQALGATIVEIRIPELAHALAAGLTLAFAETSDWHGDLLRARAGDYDPATRIMVMLGFLLTAPEVVTAQRLRAAIQRSVRGAFESHHLDALVGPTLPGPTMPVEQLASDLTRAGGQQDLGNAIRVLVGANVVGLPAVSLPCGASTSGLPLGLHLVGRPFAEAELLRVAHAYEQATTWHTRRPPLLTAPLAQKA